MRGRGPALAAVAAAIVAAVMLAGAHPGTASGSAAPHLPWTELLPPFSSPAQGERLGVARCRKARLRCLTVQVRRMKRLRGRLGCDHRAVFATTYLTLTRVARRTVRQNPRFFRQPRFFFREAALFANVYFRTVHTWNRGQPVPAAWRIGFEAARSPHVNGGQDMLLGINAHVQHDMPFVLAALSLRSPRGASRKPDHDKVNRILRRAYEPVVRAVERRYDPLLGAFNEPWNPIDNLAGVERVKTWREGVWRNAERLVNASSDAERRRVAGEIEAHAGAWASALAAPVQRDYGPRRDAYCRARLGG